MKRPSQRIAYWAAGGAIIAALLSVASLYLPLEFGGYFDWNHPHSAFHNAVAILSRLVVFALIGAALAGSWHHYRRRHRR
jgi:hypothetical protein